MKRCSLFIGQVVRIDELWRDLRALGEVRGLVVTLVSFATNGEVTVAFSIAERHTRDARGQRAATLR
jgi:hypothetical protein